MKESIYNIDYYDYELPEELIAQFPYEKRDEAKLMVLDKTTGLIRHEIFKDIINYFKEGDILVLNDTKVLPARIYGVKEITNAKIEVLLLKELKNNTWECLVKHQKRLNIGTKINFSEELIGKVIELKENGITIIEFKCDSVFVEILDKIGAMPLPPYIKEKLEDKNAYQTVYATNLGSAAAPTAGLHFTNELLEKLKEKGVKVLNVTLHVGLGTFRPVNENDIRNHDMHAEYYEITEEVAEELNNAKLNKKRIIAVGTTSLRTLESNYVKYGKFKSTKEETNIFIYPPYKIKSVNGLITNFHLPKSTLLMLVSCLSSRDKIINAYKEAIKKEYKFFSFGDAMFITNLNFKSNLKKHKEILKNIKHKEIIFNNFSILKGNNNIILSAPHAFKQLRNGKSKNNEINTSNICKLLHYYTGCHAIYTINNTNYDANYDKENPYREYLIKYINENNIKFLIDIHGIEHTCKYNIIIGTNYYKNVNNDIDKINSIIKIINENLTNNIAVDKKFKAREKTLANHINQNTGIKCIQVELIKDYRKLKRKPKLFNEVIKTFIKIVECVKEG